MLLAPSSIPSGGLSGEEKTALGIGVAFVVCVVCVFLALFCVNWRRGAGLPRPALAFATGKVLVGPWCGWGFVLKLFSVLLAAGAASYYTWAMASILSSQRYSLQDLRLEDLTAFVFTSAQADAFVHSKRAPSALLDYQFDQNAFDLRFGDFGAAGAPTQLKLFLDLSGQQFGRVRDLVELDLDLSVSNKQTGKCTISTNGRSSGSASPAPLLAAVDVQIYRNEGYVTDPGAFDVACVWTSSRASEPVVRVEFEPALGELSGGDGAVAVRAITLALFCIILFFGVLAVLERVLGSVLVLRAQSEAARARW